MQFLGMLARTGQIDEPFAMATSLGDIARDTTLRGTVTGTSRP